MAAHTLHQWLADPLFAAAEDVQESADRLESNFRTWKQETQDERNTDEVVESLRLRLVSACDTLKWQLEVFEGAVKCEGLSPRSSTLDSSARKRRQEFVDIIRLQLCCVEAQVRDDERADGVCREARELALPALKADEDKTFSQQAVIGAFSPEIVLPGERILPRIRTVDSSGSPASGLSGFFGRESPCSDRSQLPSSSSSALSGFLGAPISTQLAGSLNNLSPHGASVPRQDRNLCTEVETERRIAGNRCSSSACLSDIVEDGSARIQQGCMGGPPSPGPECKSFPSLAHIRGMQHGVHGWQCLFVWMQHLQRVSRRRMLETGKGSQGDLSLDSPCAKESGHNMASTSSRLEATQVLSLSRTSSTVNICSMDQGKRAEWHINMPTTEPPLPAEEQGKKAASAWHLNSRPRRLNTLQRPIRPASNLILVCAAAILMIAAAVCSSYARGQLFDQRHVSLLEVPSLQASSPAFP